MAKRIVSQPPVRNPAGATTDPTYGPLADSGYGNPFFYHQFADDFDNTVGSTSNGLYTVTLNGSGAAANHVAGDGGLLTLQSGSAAGNFASIQLPAGSITLPLTGNAPPSTSTDTSKVFYLCRLQVANVTTSSFIAGLGATTATPFTGGARNLLDGLFFYKAAGGTALQVINLASAGNSPSGAAFTNTFAIPTANYTLTNNINIDLAFSIDRMNNLRMYVGSQLVGWIPQSGTGATNAAGVSVLPSLGPALANYNFQAQGGSAVTPIMYSTLPLNITLGICNGATAAAMTMTADFHMFQKER